MNKYNIISIIVLTITTFITLSFNALIEFDYHLMSYVLFFTITLIMLYRKNNIRNFKFIYNVILSILSIVSIFFILVMSGLIFTYIVSPNYEYDGISTFLLLLLVLLCTLTSFHIIDFKIEKSKLNHILTWILSAIVILIYLRYHYDIDLMHNCIHQNQYEIQNSYIYLTQNYVYLVISYLSLLIHYLINKKQV